MRPALVLNSPKRNTWQSRAKRMKSCLKSIVSKQKDREPPESMKSMLRIISLNLNGIRSAWSKNVLPWVAAQQADVVCLQELKAQLPDIKGEMLAPDGRSAFYHCAEKKGYSGVGLWCRKAPDRVVEGFGNAEFDAEGR